MEKVRKNKKSQLLLKVISAFLIILSVILISTKYINLYLKEKDNDIKVKEYIDNNMDSVKDDKELDTNNYAGVLEIPKINLKRGFLSKTDTNNNVNKNIEILKDSDLPDTENSNVILASHSGNSSVSFFKDLHLLENDDVIYLYYNRIKYEYVVINVEEVKKTGYIQINKDNTEKLLTLITCKDDYSQIIITSKLNNISSY